MAYGSEGAVDEVEVGAVAEGAEGAPLAAAPETIVGEDGDSQRL